MPKFQEGSRSKCHIYNPSAGDSLIYEVQMTTGEKYLFKVFLKHYDPFSEDSDDYCAIMDWISTSARGGNGTIYTTCEGLSEAVKFINFFFPGITMLKSNMSAIFLSRKAYNERQEQTVYIDNTKISLFERMGIPHMDVVVKNKKKKYRLEAFQLTDNRSMNYADPSYKSDYQLWVQASTRSPLIVFMQLPEFKLKLLEIK
ncbi:MAG: hypothetical protein ACK4EX_07600 [Thermaurantimonas sp.]|uniref:hypothetical protein n=1 Tax=Thermaurantimonas sp. TaxID=2681568 RepID=UPI00391D3E70